MKEIALERIKSPKVKCNSIISFAFEDKKKLFFMYMYLVHQVLVLSSHNHWRKTVKEKNLKVMQIFFFMVGKMDVHFSRVRPKNFILFLSDIIKEKSTNTRVLEK